MAMLLLSFPAPPIGSKRHVIADVGILRWSTIGGIGAKYFRAKANDTVAFSTNWIWSTLLEELLFYPILPHL
jgi:hypothetical protein